MNKKQKVILFGAGLVGRQALPGYLDRTEVLAFADNDTRKQGGQVLNVMVISPDRIPLMNYDQVIITSTSTGQIFDQLIELGIPRERIKVSGETDQMLAPRFPWDAVLFLVLMMIVVLLVIGGLLGWVIG